MPAVLPAKGVSADLQPADVYTVMLDEFLMDSCTSVPVAFPEEVVQVDFPTKNCTSVPAVFQWRKV